MATDYDAVIDGKTMDEIVTSNHDVRLEQVYEAIGLMDKLRDAGVHRARYDLASPYGHATSHHGDEARWIDGSSGN